MEMEMNGIQESIHTSTSDAAASKKRRKKAKSKEALEQTDPPTINIKRIYLKGEYPVGELMEYSGHNASRISNEELRQKELIDESHYKDLRRAAEVHRQARSYIRRIVKPGMRMIDICEKLEETVRKLIAADGLKSGIGFPTGCSLNECAAHYTPNPGDETVLKQGDVMKLDFGTHVNGYIIDSAFTIAFDEKFDPLLQASKEATNVGVKEAGIDARFSEIGTAIQETMESFEIELNGKVIPIKCVRNLCGHSIGKYCIHAGKTVPIVRNSDNTRMEEGELYAIETFGSTGKGYVNSAPNCSHYMLTEAAETAKVEDSKSKALLASIQTHFSTLPFCHRYLERIGETSRYFALNKLVSAGIVEEYPPLCDVYGSYTSQMEHTVLLRPTQKEVLSRGEDY